ncbi:MAG: aminotransferase class V-fold PLP-dependent enzyme [Acidobacteriota bacterium]
MSSTPTAPRLSSERALFGVPADVHYLNCAYMAPLAPSVEEASVTGLQRKRRPWEIAPEHFFDQSERARRLFADLVVPGGDPHRVALVPAVSHAIATVVKNVTVSAGQTVVVLAEQFPSNVHAWRRKTRENDAELVVVPRPDSATPGSSWSTAVVDSIDSRCAAVALPIVHWTDGTLFDVAAIGRRCREVGAPLVLDLSQSLGALPFDQEAVQADAVISVGYKWLLGPYAQGAAWLSERFDDGAPLEESWIDRAGSQDFRRLVEPTDAYQPGALRHDAGERSNFALLPGFIAALELVHRFRPEGIQDYCRRLCSGLIERLAEHGWVTAPAGERADHLFGIRSPAGVDLDVLAARLRERQVHVSLRGDAVRISPHLWCDETDLAALEGVLTTAVTG